jgi:hypothetical protein
MRNFEEQFEKLANRARMETAPNVNVSQNIFGIISNRSKVYSAVSNEKQFRMLAFYSSAAAVIIMAAAVISYHFGRTDPMQEISQAISWVVQ